MRYLYCVLNPAQCVVYTKNPWFKLRFRNYMYMCFNSYIAGIDFRRQRVDSRTVRVKIWLMDVDPTICIQMKRKELTKTFMIISNGKKTFDLHSSYKELSIEVIHIIIPAFVRNNNSSACCEKSLGIHLVHRARECEKKYLYIWPAF